MSRLVVCTDGACKIESRVVKGKRVYDDAGHGGWAWYVDDHLWDSGAVPKTTNNRMEMQAVIEAMKRLREVQPDRTLLIVSDSAYVVNCFADRWYDGWRRRGWRNSSGQEVKNRDLWEQMLDLYDTHPQAITFRHCRGHGRGGIGDAPYVFGNDQADRLAVGARKTLER